MDDIAAADFPRYQPFIGDPPPPAPWGDYYRALTRQVGHAQRHTWYADGQGEWVYGVRPVPADMPPPPIVAPRPDPMDWFAVDVDPIFGPNTPEKQENAMSIDAHLNALLQNMIVYAQYRDHEGVTKAKREVQEYVASIAGSVDVPEGDLIAPREFSAMLRDAIRQQGQREGIFVAYLQAYRAATEDAS